MIASGPIAAQADDDDDRPASSGVVSKDGDDDDGVDTESIFGFTEGADTGEAGEAEVSFDFVGRASRLAASRRDATYNAASLEAEVEYGVTDRLKVALGMSFDFHNLRNVADADDRTGFGFNGLGAEVKWKLLDRATFPIGLAVAVEPEWSRYEEGSGERANSFGLEFRLQADAELVADRLFVAANLVYETEWAREEEENEKTGETSGKLARESSLEFSSAVAGRLSPNALLGAEIRYLQSFEGAALDSREGRALYVGPTLYVQLDPHAYLKAAWLYQIAGEAKEHSGRHLDLLNYDRHQVRLNVGYEF